MDSHHMYDPSKESAIAVLHGFLHTSNPDWLEILSGIKEGFGNFSTRMYENRRLLSTTESAGTPLGKRVYFDGYAIEGFRRMRVRRSVIVEQTDPLYLHSLVDYIEIYNDIAEGGYLVSVNPLCLVFHAACLAYALKTDITMGFDDARISTGAADMIQSTISVIIAKNADYSSAYRRHGIQGLSARLYDKLSRLINLLHTGKAPEYEALGDSAKDLLGYSIILLGMTIEDALGLNELKEGETMAHTVSYIERVCKEPIVLTNFKPIGDL